MGITCSKPRNAVSEQPLSLKNQSTSRIVATPRDSSYYSTGNRKGRVYLNSQAPAQAASLRQPSNSGLSSKKIESTGNQLYTYKGGRLIARDPDFLQKGKRKGRVYLNEPLDIFPSTPSQNMSGRSWQHSSTGNGTQSTYLFSDMSSISDSSYSDDLSDITDRS